MAARAGLGEDVLASRDLIRRLGEKRRASRCVPETMRIGRPQEEAGNVERLVLGGRKIRRVPPRGRDLNRRDRLAADQRVEVQQPFLAERADVEVHAIQRPKGAHRIGAILENPRRPDGVGPLEQLRERTRAHEVVELLVVQPAAGELLHGRYASPAADVHRAGTPRSSIAGC